MENNKKERFLLGTAYFVTLALIFYLVFRFLLVYLLPFVTGLTLSVLLQRPAAWLSCTTRIGKNYCTLFLVISAYIVLLLLAAAVLYGGYSIFVGASEKLPEYTAAVGGAAEYLRNAVSRLFAGAGEPVSSYIDAYISALPEKLLGSAADFFENTVRSVMASAPVFLISTLVTAVAGCYIAKDYERLKAFMNEAFPRKYTEKLATLKTLVFDNLFKMLKGYAVLFLLTFAELAAGFFILRINRPLFTALIVALVDILPVIGTGTVLIPWAIFLLIKGKIGLCIGMAVLYVVITVVRNFAEPRVIGKQVGLHPLITLIALFVGLKLFGFAGMILTPPTVIIVFKYLEMRFRDDGKNGNPA